MSTLSFLFVDQVGSTAQLQALDERTAQRVRRALQDVLREAVEEHSGQVVDHTGDGVMAMFTGARDAVASAVAMQQSTTRHNRRAPEAENISLRVGIHTGEVSQDEEGRHFGLPVVVAARLCASAVAGEIRTSEVTRSLAEPAGEQHFESLGTLDLKGISEPVPSASVDWVPLDTAFPLPNRLAELNSAPLVERNEDLEWLRRFWVEAEQGSRQVVLLTGTAGVGKSRLAAALAGEVHAGGGLVLAGNCDEVPSSTYQPVVEALDSYVASAPRAELRAAVGPYAGPLLQLLPGIARRIPNLASAPPTEDVGSYFLVEAIDAFLQTVARSMPVLLVMDDLQWASREALSLLRELARSQRAAYLLVVGCYAEPDVGRSRVLTELGIDPQHSSDIGHRRLGGLSKDGVVALLTALLPNPPSVDLVRAVESESEGIPYFVRQLGLNAVKQEASTRVDASARKTSEARLDLRAVREELVSGLLDLQELRLGTSTDTPLQVVTTPEPDGTPPAPMRPPYRGLLPFTVSDAEFFHGRERVTAQLLARLAAARLVAAIGPSGSGKSSLVRAGVIPALAGDALPGSSAWRTAVFTPGSTPVRALRDALDKTSGAANRRVIVVDQFEEVLLACGEQQRAEFLHALTDLVRDDGDCSVVLTLRADFYGQFAAYPRFAAELADSNVLVGPMDEDELRRAILVPAQLAGCIVETGLFELILQDASEQPGALPLVSTALLETWERRRGRSLTRSGYAESGGVQGAVARLADSVYEDLTPLRRDVAKRLMLQLIEPGEGTTDLRRRVTRAELPDDADTRVVLDALVARRLVIADAETVEIAHEALLAAWPRLRGWLDEDREGRLQHRQLREAVATWVVEDRDREQLWRGVKLAAAQEWLRNYTGELNVTERGFLTAARAEQRRKVRRTRNTMAVLASLLVLALIAGSIALVQTSRARHQADVADGRGLAGQAAALSQQKLDASLLLAVEGFRHNHSIDTEAGLLTALNAGRHLERFVPQLGTDTYDVAVAAAQHRAARLTNSGRLDLFDTTTWRPIGPPLQKPAGSPAAVNFGDGGRRLVAWDKRGLSVYDGFTGRHISGPFGPKDSNGPPPSFFPGGRRLLVTSYADFTVASYDVISGKRGRVYEQDNQNLSEGRLSHDGKTIALSNLESLDIVDAATGRTLRSIPASAIQVNADLARFNADDTEMLVGDIDNHFIRVSVGTGKPIGSPLQTTGSRVSSLGFSADGKRLVASGDDGGVRVWEAASSAPIATLSGLSGAASGACLDAPCTRVLGTTAESAAIWNLNRVTNLGAAAKAGDPQGELLTEVVDLGDGRLATFGTSAQLKIWDRSLHQIGKTLTTQVGADGRLTAAALITGGSDVLLGGSHTFANSVSGSRVIVVDTHSMETKAVIDIPSVDGATQVAPDPTGRRAVVTSLGKMALVDLRTRQTIGKTVQGDSGFVTGIAWDAQGNRVFTGGQEGTLKIWRTANGLTLQKSQVLAPNWDLSDVRRDGQQLLVSAEDGSLRRVDQDTLASKTTYVAGGTQLQTAIAGVDDDHVYSTSRDGRLRIWDKASGVAVGPPLEGHDELSRGAFAAGPDQLITVGGDTLIRWDLDPAGLSRQACGLAGRNLTKLEWRRYLPGQTYRRTCPQYPAGS
ncbi:MAG: AAA family ATPase [Actinomycetes bacterium]